MKQKTPPSDLLPIRTALYCLLAVVLLVPSAAQTPQAVQEGFAISQVKIEIPTTGLATFTAPISTFNVYKTAIALSGFSFQSVPPTITININITQLVNQIKIEAQGTPGIYFYFLMTATLPTQSYIFLFSSNNQPPFISSQGASTYSIQLGSQSAVYQKAVIFISTFTASPSTSFNLQVSLFTISNGLATLQVTANTFTAYTFTAILWNTILISPMAFFTKSFIVSSQGISGSVADLTKLDLTIPTQFANGRCTLGINAFQFPSTPSASQFFNFKASTNPISQLKQSLLAPYLIGFDMFCLASCPNGSVFTNGTCTAKLCGEFCITCIGTICSLCQPNTRLINNVCTTCPGGVCPVCNPPCLQCSQNNFCIQCQPNYIVVFGICSQCNPPCLTCNATATGTTCTSCPSGYLLLNNFCIMCSSGCKTCTAQTQLATLTSQTDCTQCYTNYVLKSQDKTCEFICPPGCDKCVGFSCIKCPVDFNLISGNCIRSCPNPCTACDPRIGEFNKSCTSCKTGYTLKNSQCFANCPSYCTSCTNLTVCLSCSLGYQLINGVCQVNCSSPCGNCTSTGCFSCISKFYFSGTTCLACPTQCQTCNTPTFCTSCISNFRLDNNQCLIICNWPCSSCTPDGRCMKCVDNFFLDANAICLQCNSLCKTCLSSADNCITCNANYDLVGSTCALNCGNQCRQCTNKVCAQCISGYMLMNSRCTACVANCVQCSAVDACTTCQQKYYAVTNPSACKACDVTCASCTIQTSCTSCISGYFSQGAANGGTPTLCTPCPGNCATCTTNGCLSCGDGNFLSSGLCTACSTGCQTCTLTECRVCVNGYTLNAGKCSIKCAPNCLTCLSANTCANCASNYYNLNGGCVLCDQGCSSCLSSTVCQTCGLGFTLNGNTCTPQCTYPCNNCTQTTCLTCVGCFYPSGLTCLPCNSLCLTCTSLNVCLTCISNAPPVNGACLASCPAFCSRCDGNGRCITCADGYFLQNLICNPCLYPCETCITASSVCLSCRKNFTLSDSTCTLQCTAPCLLCQTADYCIKCDDGAFLLNGKCNFCPLNCQKCNSVSSCDICNSGYMRSGNGCVPISTNVQQSNNDLLAILLGTLLPLLLLGLLGLLCWCCGCCDTCIARCCPRSNVPIPDGPVRATPIGQDEPKTEDRIKSGGQSEVYRGNKVERTMWDQQLHIRNVVQDDMKTRRFVKGQEQQRNDSNKSFHDSDKIELSDLNEVNYEQRQVRSQNQISQRYYPPTQQQQVVYLEEVRQAPRAEYIVQKPVKYVKEPAVKYEYVKEPVGVKYEYVEEPLKMKYEYVEEPVGVKYEYVEEPRYEVVERIRPASQRRVEENYYQAGGKVITTTGGNTREYLHEEASEVTESEPPNEIVYVKNNGGNGEKILYRKTEYEEGSEMYGEEENQTSLETQTKKAYKYRKEEEEFYQEQNSMDSDDRKKEFKKKNGR